MLGQARFNPDISVHEDWLIHDAAKCFLCYNCKNFEIEWTKFHPYNWVRVSVMVFNTENHRDWQRYWVSEWLLFNTKGKKNSAIPWREQVIWLDEMMMMFVLYKTTTLFFICIVLSHWHNMFLQLDTLFWFRANKTLIFFYLFNAAAKRRSNKYQFYSLSFDPTVARTHDLPHSIRKR